MKMLLAILVVVVVFYPDQSDSVITLGQDLKTWIVKYLKEHQDGITKIVQDVTVKGEGGRLSLSNEVVPGKCEPVKNDALKGQYTPNDIKGKWYGVLVSNDIYQMGDASLLEPNRFCVQYDITPTGNGLLVKETSSSDKNGKNTQSVAATLTQNKVGTATFDMAGKDLTNKFNFAQLTTYKGSDYAVWYYTRDNGNSTCTMKMAVMTRTPKITVSALLMFHDIVLIKNLKQLNLHPRLFHVDQATCPAL